jgi:hypothetical protein
VVNALRQIPQFQEIQVRLQTNEVLLHAPEDVDLGAAFQAIKAAGYSPDSKVWVTAYGRWDEAGFRPEGWEQAIAVPPSAQPADAGPWKLLFERTDQGWSLLEAGPIEAVPVVVDIDAKK